MLPPPSSALHCKSRYLPAHALAITSQQTPRMQNPLFIPKPISDSHMGKEGYRGRLPLKQRRKMPGDRQKTSCLLPRDS